MLEIGQALRQRHYYCTKDPAGTDCRVVVSMPKCPDQCQLVSDGISKEGKSAHRTEKDNAEESDQDGINGIGDLRLPEVEMVTILPARLLQRLLSATRVSMSSPYIFRVSLSPCPQSRTFRCALWNQFTLYLWVFLSSLWAKKCFVACLTSSELIAHSILAETSMSVPKSTL